MSEDYKTRLKNRLFGLLCEYEKEREWRKYLDAILIELHGFAPEEQTSAYLHLVHNLSACRFLSYEFFRSTIFDCMSLVDKL
jgi:hypothetical protein